MPNRAERRAAAREALKLLQPSVPQPTKSADIPEPAAPSNSSPARLAANKANAQFSTGPTSQTGLAVSSQNRTTHGLARHNGVFKLLPTEDPAAFESLKQSLINEHQPTTPTESILVNTMAESHWLTNRAQTLQDTCFDPDTGQLANDKMFALYLRYQTTHNRAFHKALHDLLKLRSEKRKADAGSVAQEIKSEQHLFKKETHYWDVLRKDGEVCHQIAENTIQKLSAMAIFPNFEAEFNNALAQHRLKLGNLNPAEQKAA